MTDVTVRTQAGSPTNTSQLSSSKTTFQLSNGNVLVLARSLAGSGDAGTANNIYVYEVLADRTLGTPTLRATITAPIAFGEIIGATFPNNDLGIAVVSTDKKTIRYCKLTYSGYTAAAWETVKTTSGARTLTCPDMTVTDTSFPVVSYLEVDTTTSTSQANYAAYGRTLTGGAWTLVFNEFSSSSPRGYSGLACAVIGLGGSSTARDFVFAYGLTSTSTDVGIRIYKKTLNETNGSIVNATAIVEDIMPNTAYAGTGGVIGHRLVRLYRLATNEFAIMVLNKTLTKKIGFKTATLSGTTYTTKVPLATLDLPPSASILNFATAAKVPSARVEGLYYGTFTFLYSEVSGSRTSLRSVVLRQTGSKIHAGFTSGNVFATVSNGVNNQLMGSMGDRNLSVSRSDIYWEAYSSVGGVTTGTGRLSYADIPVASSSADPAIRELIPTTGAGVQTQTPGIGAKVAFGQPNYTLVAGQSKYKAEFQFAQDAGFTNAISYLQPDTKYTEILNASLTNPKVLSDTLPPSNALTSGVTRWEYRVRLIDEYYNYGPWKSSYFVIGHPSMGVPVSPAEGKVYHQNGGLVNFDWTFSDPSATDYQTAYRVVLYDDLGGVIHDTGKVTSDAKRFTYQYNVANSVDWLNASLYWTVETWDSADQSVPNPPMTQFMLSNPPQADLETIQSLAVDTNPTVGTGVPVIAGTLKSGGTSVGSTAKRQIKEYTLSITQNGVPIWTKQVVGPFPDGYDFAEKVPTGYLNEDSYTISASAVDDANIAGSTPMYQFTVNWIAPAGPAAVVANTALYNTEDQGYILVTWDDASREVNNFTSWNVYRKDDMINSATGEVIEEGERVLIHTTSMIAASYEYKDYYAPSGYKVTYSITQNVNRQGQDIESDAETAAVVVTYPSSDGYWLINPDSTQTSADAFRLSIVTSDEFSEEQEESEFVVIGRGRQVQKGEVLGVKGQLSCQIRDNGGTTARQKRLRLKEIQKAKGQLWLRNPFGDIFKVNVSNMSVSRIAGVGASEFCDITLPYSEVSS